MKLRKGSRGFTQQKKENSRRKKLANFNKVITPGSIFHAVFAITEWEDPDEHERGIAIPVGSLAGHNVEYDTFNFAFVPFLGDFDEDGNPIGDELLSSYHKVAKAIFESKKFAEILRVEKNTALASNITLKTQKLNEITERYDESSPVVGPFSYKNVCCMVALPCSSTGEPKLDDAGIFSLEYSNRFEQQMSSIEIVLSDIYEAYKNAKEEWKEEGFDPSTLSGKELEMYNKYVRGTELFNFNDAGVGYIELILKYPVPKNLASDASARIKKANSCANLEIEIAEKDQRKLLTEDVDKSVEDIARLRFDLPDEPADISKKTFSSINRSAEDVKAGFRNYVFTAQPEIQESLVDATIAEKYQQVTHVLTSMSIHIPELTDNIIEVDDTGSVIDAYVSNPPTETVESGNVDGGDMTDVEEI